MNTKLILLALVSGFSLQPFALLAQGGGSGTTIDAVNRYAYGSNLGWLDWRGDTNHGVVIATNVCSGYIYSANVGWINLGSGFPVNGLHYQNNSASDFGVNLDASGNLTGYAYGGNIGWITFEQTYGQPKVNLATGNLSGYVWSANCGWISLSNTVAHVQTTAIQQSAPPVTAPKLGGITFAADGGGSCGFCFTNIPGASSRFTVWATTNLTQPFTPFGGPMLATAATLTLTNNPTNAARFFRIQFSP
jgi:hypothetical protein